MVSDTQQSLLEKKVDRIEEQVTKLVRQVEGDEILGVLGIRDYIKLNEEWKRNTETLLLARDRNISVERNTMLFIVTIAILGVIILFFMWDYSRSGNIAANITTDWVLNGFNNWLLSNFPLWN